jgi:hypothetical protein
LFYVLIADFISKHRNPLEIKMPIIQIPILDEHLPTPTQPNKKNPTNPQLNPTNPSQALQPSQPTQSSHTVQQPIKIILKLLKINRYKYKYRK